MENGTSIKRAAVGWWSKSYLIDYIVCIVMIIISAIFGLVINPFKMELPGGDQNPTVGYSYKKSTVPTVAAGVIAFGIPIFIFVVWQIPQLLFFRKQYRVKSYGAAGNCLRDILFELHSALLGLLFSGTIMIFTVTCYKTFAGRYRPNYFALVAAGEDELDGRRSFPSGHSATSFAGLFYLSLWLSGKLKLFHPGKAGETWKILLCFAPAFCAFFIAITRTRDYYHNFSDIIAGSDLGIIAAIIGYFCVYPSLLSKKSGYPKQRKNVPEAGGLSDPAEGAYSAASESTPFEI